MFQAARKDNTEFVAALLNARARPDVQDANAQTPLFLAARDGLNQVVRLLVEARANPNTMDSQSKTPLYYAIYDSRAQTAAFLLDEYQAGQELAIKDFSRIMENARERGLTEIVDRLQKAEGVAKERAKKQATLRDSMLKAAKSGSPEQIDALLAAGASALTAEPGTKHTALHIAAARDDAQAAEVLLKLLRGLPPGTSPDAGDQRRQTPLFVAASEGLAECVDCLLKVKCDLEKADDQDETALFCASRGGHTETVCLLLMRTAYPDHQNAAGLKPLHVVARTPAVAGKSLSGVLAALLYLGGVQPSVTDAQLRTALFDVADDERASVLVEQRCDVNKCDKRGQTALFSAAAGGREAVVRLLLDSKATVDGSDTDGRTALHSASGALCTRLLLEARAVVDVRDNGGRTPLFFAAERGDQEAVSMLVLDGANGAAFDTKQETPLHRAALHQAPPALLRMLVEEGWANPIAKDKKKQTALQLAQKNGSDSANRRQVIELLQTASRSFVAPRDQSKLEKYFFCFDPPSEDSSCLQRMPFGDPAYDMLLRKLSEECSWLQPVLPEDAPLSQGPPVGPGSLRGAS
eukprot:gnl/TRDRNA2_/TRDRNA2_144341_c5_seq1.p1 gnl/TRDRNA2_/TRDRNA2_144341_c5~~gnl/TRDRNA2_/TRDRNA2_144341_c5_seq1.p1  ORF type:complete len:590 (+),score=129.51 gnl/TRDRNA2_/TRDRNA2_144341_c5_seq1:32-1771(+)